MYGSGYVSTTQHSTEITPKTSNSYQVSKKQQHSQIYMRYFWGSLPILKYVQQKLCNPCSGVSLPVLHLHSFDNLKFRLYTLASFMLFLLCSSLHLWIMEAGNSKTPLAGEVYLVVWRVASLGMQSLPTVQSPYSLHSILSAYRKGQLTAPWKKKRLHTNLLL